MRRVSERVRARLGDGERGSYAVTVAVLSLALLALMALTIDTGMVYHERHELQNAADAGALAVAFNCARGGPCNPADADALATANATTDGVAGVESVDIDMGEGEVTVVTRSEATDGSDSLYLAAARVFGMESLTVRARATAAWGPAGSLATIPFVISFCDLEGGLDAQGGYVDLPPPSGWGTVITFHDPAVSGESCDGYPGFDMYEDEVLPGGFGMLELDAPCRVRTYTDDDGDVWAPVKSGTGIPSDWRCLEVGQVMTLPVFLDFRTSPREYRIGGYAAFVVTGWRITGSYTNPGTTPCGAPTSCISGWFTEASVSEGGFGDVDFGVRTARLIR